MTVSACARAEANTPDPTNPAHCIAAFHYGAYWLSQKEGYRQNAAVEIAKAFYLKNKIKASGQSVELAQTEGKRINNTYFEDGKVMDELYSACTTPLEDDPELKRQLPALVELAKPMAENYRAN